MATASHDSSQTGRLLLVDSATAANGAPSASTVGEEVPSYKPGSPSETASVRVYSTAGSGTMTLSYVRLWGRSRGETRWFPLGTGADADKGKINGTTIAFGETGTDSIAHAEPFLYLGHFDFLYAEIGVVGGTATAISVDILIPKG